MIAHLTLLPGLSLLAAGLLWAAASDLTRYLIPNRACLLVLAASGLALAGAGPLALLGGLATGAAVLAVGVLLFATGRVGGGDVKLAAAVAVAAGPGLFSTFAFVTALAAVFLALVLLSPLRRLMPAAPGSVEAGVAQPMPFGVPLAAGGLAVVALRLSPLLQG